jgi:hypothetical protein
MLTELNGVFTQNPPGRRALNGKNVNRITWELCHAGLRAVHRNLRYTPPENRIINFSGS